MLNSEQLRIEESYPLPVCGGGLPLTEGRSYKHFIEDNQLRNIKETEKIYLIFESLAPQICPVIAIDRSGLLFQFVDTGDIKLESACFDIIRSGEGLLIEQVKIQEIILVTSENQLRSEFTSIKYCYVSVQPLSFQHKTGMEFLFRRFTE